MIDEAGIWPVRLEAEPVGLRLHEMLGGTLYRPWQNGQISQKDQFAKVYREHHLWLLIMATGIAVRFLEGLPADKKSDPGVIVVDEGCRYVVALLGGHEGGSNNLAFSVANYFGAVPVVTTATESLKPLVLGIGCRRGTPTENIEAAVLNALGARQLHEVREIATIDLKADEPGLLEFCSRHALPLRSFGREQVAQRPWVTEPSEFVKEKIAVLGVCEPCALMASPRGRLIVAKMALNGVAVAVVEDSWKHENLVKQL
jgi:cobalt-precorrin 5A hydrolase